MFGKICLRLSAAALLAAAGVTSVSAATYTQYSDRGTFAAAAGATTTEDFNSYNTNVAIPGGAAGLDVGDFSVSSTTAPHSLLRIDSDGSSGYNIDGSSFLRGIGFGGQTFTFTFDTAITSFGVDLFAVNDGAERSQVLVGGQTFSMPIFNGNQHSFFGIISDMAFTTVTFATLLPEDGSMDNITYGNAAVVPLPAPFLLLFGALAGLGLVATRRTA